MRVALQIRFMYNDHWVIRGVIWVYTIRVFMCALHVNSGIHGLPANVQICSRSRFNRLKPYLIACALKIQLLSHIREIPTEEYSGYLIYLGVRCSLLVREDQIKHVTNRRSGISDLDRLKHLAAVLQCIGQTKRV